MNELQTAVDNVLEMLDQKVREAHAEAYALARVRNLANAARAMEKYGIVVVVHPTTKLWVATWGTADGGDCHEVEDNDYCCAVMRIVFEIDATRSRAAASEEPAAPAPSSLRCVGGAGDEVECELHGAGDAEEMPEVK